MTYLVYMDLKGILKKKAVILREKNHPVLPVLLKTVDTSLKCKVHFCISNVLMPS